MENSKETMPSSEQVIRSTENELLRAYVSSLLETTTNIDKFTAWFLAGTGAIASFLIANINDVSKFIPICTIKVSLFILAFSFFCGLCQKLLSLSLHIDFDQESKLRERFKDLKDRGHAEIIQKEAGLTKRVIHRFRDLHPWFIKIFMAVESKDIDSPIKKRIRRYYLQYFWVILSLISFLFFMLLLSWEIKIT
jgi:hypothetical protein